MHDEVVDFGEEAATGGDTTFGKKLGFVFAPTRVGMFDYVNWLCVNMHVPHDGPRLHPKHDTKPCAQHESVSCGCGL